ncbi:MAG: hypothetical protein EOO24_20355 [Comamonadaceae bacterium]|nr:MAG: hypothetical protein EOO24_20355 [Comamonadaceae bacterium]
MSDIHIERHHLLGLPRAQQVAHAWMQEARERWGLEFQHQPWPGAADEEGAADQIRFSGMGADGQAQVSASAFSVQLTLNGLMAAFGPMVEEKMARKLDELLAAQGPGG